jgi:hypothetical protein
MSGGIVIQATLVVFVHFHRSFHHIAETIIIVYESPSPRVTVTERLLSYNGRSPWPERSDDDVITHHRHFSR